MTDDEFHRLLVALATRHLAPHRAKAGAHYALHEVGRLRYGLDQVTNTARLLQVVRDRSDQALLLELLQDELMQLSPVELSTRAMHGTGLLDALEDGGRVVLAQLRRGAVPAEDSQFLRDAGYSDADIEVLLASVIQDARSGAVSTAHVLDQLEAAAEDLRRAAQRLQAPAPPQSVGEPRKKRKLFNGIGKVLGGTIAGVGNALMAAGTILAPNSATAAGSIASAGVAVTAILTGVGDLRGE